MTHAVTMQTDGPRRRWVCTACPWASDWTPWTDAPAAIAAIRHERDAR